MRLLASHRVAFMMAGLPLLLLCGARAGAASAPADRGNADRFPTVSVDVTPLDSNNMIVSDLKPADFEVKEDGKPVAQPRVMTLADAPRGDKPELNLMLVFDNSKSTSKDRMRAAADRFLAGLQPQDRVAVVVGSTRHETVPIQLPDPAGNKLARAKLIQDLTSDWKLVRGTIERIEILSVTPLLDALALAAREAMRLPQGSRAAIVVLSDGRDNYSLLTQEEAIAKLREARRPVFLIGISPRGIETVLRRGINEPLLRSIATATGGAYFHAADDANKAREAYDEILKRLNGAYRLTFESANLDAKRVKRGYEVSLPSRQLSFALQLDIPAARAIEQALLVVTPVLDRQLGEVSKHAAAAESTAKQADEAHAKLGDAIGRQSYGEAHASLGRLRPLGPAVEAEKANAEKIKPGEGCDPAVFASVSGEEKARKKTAEIEKEKARTAAAAARVAEILKKLPLEEAVLTVKPILDRQAAELRRHADAAQAAVKQAEDALSRGFNAIKTENYGEAFGCFERIRQAGPAVAAEERAAARFTLDEVPPAPFATAKGDPRVSGVLKAIDQEKAKVAEAGKRAADLAQQAIVPELRAALGLMSQKPDDAALRQNYLPRIESFIRDPATVQPKKEHIRPEDAAAIPERYLELVLADADRQRAAANFEGARKTCEGALALLDKKNVAKPDRLRWRLGLSLAALAEKHGSEAERPGLFDKAVGLLRDSEADFGPNAVECYLAIARSCLAVKRPEEAGRAIGQVFKIEPANRSLPALCLELARSWLDRKEPGKAKEAFEMARKADPANQDAQEQLGRLSYDEGMAAQGAAGKAPFEKVVQLLGPLVKNRPAVAMLVAMAHYKLGNFPAAIDLFRCVAPKDARVCLYLALSLYNASKGDAKEIVELCKEAAHAKTLPPKEFALACDCCGLTLYLRLNRWDEGVKWCLMAVKADPSLRSGHPILGVEEKK